MHIAKVVNIFVGFCLIATCWANNNLHTKYKWRVIDFKYETAEKRQQAIESGAFIQTNVIPVGMDVHENRLFVSFPRLKSGVPASLAVINLDEPAENDAPLLKPYPSWQSHQTTNPNDVLDIVSPFHIKVDRCNHLWIIDTGIDDMLNATKMKRVAPARVTVINLRDDNILQRYELPHTTLDGSIFSNIVVDDNDCDNIFAYIADAATPPTLTVYSFKEKASWQVKHNFFHFDPLAGNFSLLGTKFQTNDGLYGLALTEQKENGYPDLFFHALTSRNEFNVSTKILRDKNIFENDKLKTEHYKDFKIIGSRKTNEQAGAAVYDPKEKVIFYTLPNNNEIACWRTTKNYSVSNVFTSPVEMVYPISVTIDTNHQLWILSNNMQDFIYAKLDVHKINFYIHMTSVSEAIKNTPCELNFVEKVFNKFSDNGSNGTKPIAILTLIASVLVLFKQIF
ncbi:L-dopachrome tautomerase yellow-f-like [Contarinia nasturtii]|uniref:L-dopachrome tautomerase yellow-f-like n=1 Tax=Contarinia nasturtii TaxID=265458 RepID=UPI0012D42014|nr:L-dopachrome tautomerase yellow-f-like [Contarinia nasturtii]